MPSCQLQRLPLADCFRLATRPVHLARDRVRTIYSLGKRASQESLLPSLYCTVFFGRKAKTAAPNRERLSSVLRMASHWPPSKRVSRGENPWYLYPGVAPSWVKLSVDGWAHIEPPLPRSRLCRRSENAAIRTRNNVQLACQTKAKEKSQLSAFFAFEYVQNAEDGIIHLQNLGYRIFIGPLLTHFFPRPIIGLFCQPSRSRDAETHRKVEVQDGTFHVEWPSSGCRAIGSEGRDDAPIDRMIFEGSSKEYQTPHES